MAIARITVGSRIRMDRDVSRHLVNRVRALLTWSNPAVGFKRSRGWWVSPKEDKDIKGYSMSKDYIYIPRGFLERLELILKAEGIRYEIEDNRTWYKPRPINDKIKLFPHQILPVKDMLNYDEGLFEAPCGSGKSVMALKLACAWGQPTLVLAHTNAIMDQWAEYVEEFTGRTPGLIHGSTFDIQDITIGSVMTLVNRTLDSDFLQYFGCVVLDEAHHTPAYSFQSVLTRFFARKRIGITATPRRSDGLQGLLNAVAGPIRTRVLQEDLYRTGFAIRPTVYRVRTDFKVDAYTESREDLLFEAIETDEGRADLVATMALQPAMEQRSGLILSRRIAHLDLIHERLFEQDPGWAAGRSKVLTGRLRRDERLRILRRLRKGRLSSVLATQLADEGLDIPRLDTLFLTFPTASDLKIEQQIGRVMRTFPGKKDVRIYDFIDLKVPRLAKQAKKRKALYKRLGYPIKRATVPTV